MKMLYICKISNVSKQQIKDGAVYNARFGYKGRIEQSEFHNLTNKMIVGIPTYIKGVKVEPTQSPMPETKVVSIPLTRAKDIPEELKKYIGTPKFKEALDEYNKAIKDRNDKYTKRREAYVQNYDVRNQYYNDIMLVCLRLGITAYSPCGKTWWEAKAQYDFEGSFPKDDIQITDEQIAYVECNALKYGLELPTNDYRIASREAFAKIIDRSSGYPRVVGSKSHGFTQEVQRVIHTRENFFESRFGEKIGRSKESLNRALHPDELPEEWLVQQADPTRGQYAEVYKQLKYIESLDPETRDMFIAEGYCRCPHCKEITRKVDDGVRVFCEYCNEELEEFIYTRNDHILYGTDIDNSYSNLDDVQDFANSQIDNEGDEDELY